MRSLFFIMASIIAHTSTFMWCTQRNHNDYHGKIPHHIFMSRDQYFKKLASTIFKTDDMPGNPGVILAWDCKHHTYAIIGTYNDGYEGPLGILGNSTTLINAIEEANNNNRDAAALVHTLLDFDNVDVNEQDPWGTTPLMQACHGEKTSIVQLLLYHKATLQNMCYRTGHIRHSREALVGNVVAHGTSPAILQLLVDHSEFNYKEYARLKGRAQSCIDTYKRLLRNNPSKGWRTRLNVAKKMLAIMQTKEGIMLKKTTNHTAMHIHHGISPMPHAIRHGSNSMSGQLRNRAPTASSHSPRPPWKQ